MIITSPQTSEYNCIAWAAGDSSNWWEPDPFKQYYWPENVRRRYSLQDYLEAFRAAGYEVCQEGVLEPGFCKIALYVDPDNNPTHAARQLPNGRWTSKLGPAWDVEHDFIQTWGDAYLEGNFVRLSDYGSLTVLMRKPI